VAPDIRKDPQYDEPVNIDMEPEEAMTTLLSDPPSEEESEE
jgi:hypothetical protein